MKAMVAVSNLSRTTEAISPYLIDHVRQILKVSVEYAATHDVLRSPDRINAYSPYALPAYIIAVAAVEAFFNESFFGDLMRETIKQSALGSLERERLEGLNLMEKLVFVPRVLFGQSFCKGCQPYQDMDCLVKVRNSLVHYRMDFTSPPFVQDLVQKKRALIPEGYVKDIGYNPPWSQTLSCTEGIRWAHNTACGTVNGLRSLVPVDSVLRIVHMDPLAGNFQLISELDMIKWYGDNGLDLSS